MIIIYEIVNSQLSINPIIRGAQSARNVYNLSRAKKSFVKMIFFAIYLMCLMAYLGMFRKSKKVLVSNFDPKGVKTSLKHNPGS